MSWKFRVFIATGCLYLVLREILHIPPDLVVARWDPYSEACSGLDFPFIHSGSSHGPPKNNVSNISELKIYH
jgi:hypothetical protein